MIGPVEELKPWTSPSDPQYVLFKTICHLLSEKIQQDEEDPLEIAIPIKDVAEAWSKTAAWKPSNRVDALRSASVYLQRIEKWRLFHRTHRYLFVTATGYALGIAIFPDILGNPSSH